MIKTHKLTVEEQLLYALKEMVKEYSDGYDPERYPEWRVRVLDIANAAIERAENQEGVDALEALAIDAVTTSAPDNVDITWIRGARQ